MKSEAQNHVAVDLVADLGYWGARPGLPAERPDLGQAVLAGRLRNALLPELISGVMWAQDSLGVAWEIAK